MSGWLFTYKLIDVIQSVNIMKDSKTYDHSKQTSVFFNMWSYSFDHLYPKISLFWDCPCPSSIYQISIQNILSDQIPYVFVYVWDVCACVQFLHTWEDMNKSLCEVLRRTWTALSFHCPLYSLESGSHTVLDTTLALRSTQKPLISSL